LFHHILSMHVYNKNALLSPTLFSPHEVLPSLVLVLRGLQFISRDANELNDKGAICIPITKKLPVPGGGAASWAVMASAR
jgi:hypothetical protein